MIDANSDFSKTVIGVCNSLIDEGFNVVRHTALFFGQREKLATVIGAPGEDCLFRGLLVGAHGVDHHLADRDIIDTIFLKGINWHEVWEELNEVSDVLAEAELVGFIETLE